MNTRELAIVPTFLCRTFSEFTLQARAAESLFPYAQVDVMDGVFVPSRSFTDIIKINDLQSPLQYELHLMVEDPIAEMDQWSLVKNIFRVIFHIESKADPLKSISAARARNWQVGIALNPETPLTEVGLYYDLIDVVLFMSVHPGRQGQKLLPEMGEKVIQFAHLSDRPICMLDGGINKDTINMIKSWEVEIACVGSALFHSGKPLQETYQELLTLCST